MKRGEKSSSGRRAEGGGQGAAVEAHELIELAWRFQHGDGVKKNARRAFELKMKAAVLGDARAQAMVAYALFEGRGCRRDVAESLQWYRRAARRGDVFALHNLGRIYLYDLSVPKDARRGHRWLLRAAQSRPLRQDEAGQKARTASMLSVGINYARGLGVRRNLSEGRRWLRMASRRGNTNAMVNLGFIVDAEDDDPSAAARWFRRAAALGNVMAMRELAQLHLDGRGVRRDAGRARALLRTAARKEHDRRRADGGAAARPAAGRLRSWPDELLVTARGQRL